MAEKLLGRAKLSAADLFGPIDGQRSLFLERDGRRARAMSSAHEEALRPIGHLCSVGKSCGYIGQALGNTKRSLR